MNKRLSFIILSCVVSLSVCAQWSANDSIKLRRALNSEEEIKLNEKMKNKINFGSSPQEPLTLDEKPGLQYDETMPIVLPEKKPAYMTLRPYKPGKKYNYDPIYNKRIQVERQHKEEYTPPFMPMNLIPSNWAQNWRDSKARNSLEQIEATGIKRMMGVERANNMAVPSYVILPVNENAVSVGDGRTMTTTGAGASFGGFDFMKPFTREFWDKKGRKRRERTLEVLKNYGDSTTVNWNQEIIR